MLGNAWAGHIVEGSAIPWPTVAVCGEWAVDHTTAMLTALTLCYSALGLSAEQALAAHWGVVEPPAHWQQPLPAPRPPGAFARHAPTMSSAPQPFALPPRPGATAGRHAPLSAAAPTFTPPAHAQLHFPGPFAHAQQFCAPLRPPPLPPYAAAPTPTPRRNLGPLPARPGTYNPFPCVYEPDWPPHASHLGQRIAAALNRRPGVSVRHEMLINASFVKRFIGEKGCNINAVKSLSGCDVYFDADQAPPSQPADSRLVVFVGEPREVIDAEQRILALDVPPYEGKARTPLKDPNQCSRFMDVLGAPFVPVGAPGGSTGATSARSSPSSTADGGSPPRLSSPVPFGGAGGAPQSFLAGSLADTVGQPAVTTAATAAAAQTGPHQQSAAERVADLQRQLAAAERVAELERQLAAARAEAAGVLPPVTATAAAPAMAAAGAATAGAPYLPPPAPHLRQQPGALQPPAPSGDARASTCEFATAMRSLHALTLCHEPGAAIDAAKQYTEVLPTHPQAAAKAHRRLGRMCDEEANEEECDDDDAPSRPKPEPTRAPVAALDVHTQQRPRLRPLLGGGEGEGEEARRGDLPGSGSEGRRGVGHGGGMEPRGISKLFEAAAFVDETERAAEACPPSHGDGLEQMAEVAPPLVDAVSANQLHTQLGLMRQQVTSHCSSSS